MCDEYSLRNNIIITDNKLYLLLFVEKHHSQVTIEEHQCGLQKLQDVLQTVQTSLRVHQCSSHTLQGALHNQPKKTSLILSEMFQVGHSDFSLQRETLNWKLTVKTDKLVSQVA